MTTDLEDMLTRLTDMQKDVIPFSDAVPVATYAQEATDYWTNRITGFSVEEDSQDLQIITYTIDMTLVLATTTEGYELGGLKMPSTVIPTVLLYFGQRRQLKRTSADASVTNLYPRGAMITQGLVDEGAQQSGIGQQMVVATFTIAVPMYQQTNQVIF